MPIVRRSKSKVSFDPASSPYIPQLQSKNSFKTCLSLKHKKSSSQIQESLSDALSKAIKRHSTLNLDTRMLEEEKAKSLESLLYEQLNQMSPHKQYKTEIQIIDGIYSEIALFFNKFERILMILREKLETCITRVVEEQLWSKMERVEKLNENLVKKINALSNLHQASVEENKKIRSELDYYERIFKETPGFIVNYQNIVDKMIDQCKLIENLRAEIKKLKKIQLQDSKTISELKLKKKINLDISY